MLLPEISYSMTVDVFKFCNENVHAINVYICFVRTDLFVCLYVSVSVQAVTFYELHHRYKLTIHILPSTFRY